MNKALVYNYPKSDPCNKAPRIKKTFLYTSPKKNFEINLKRMKLCFLAHFKEEPNKL